MKVLVVGAGGREHALVWKLRQSPKVTKIYCAPGNAGIRSLAECVAIPANQVEQLADFAVAQGIDLTVVGPEEALTLGIVDQFTARGLRAFGPGRLAAALEGSKAFMKDLLQKYGIPSGFYQVFSEREGAVRYIREQGAPLVVKADGLAAGKGVIVAATEAEAIAAVDLILRDQAFGAGQRVVVEEFLPGEEASFLAFTDGITVRPLPTSQDHKAVFDNDQGPNTGGMGAYSPAPVVTEAIHRQVMETVMYPTVRAMAAEGRPYKGVLYAGLMIKDGVAKVLEFNCRFGDPEAQPLLMRVETDLVEVMEAILDERLAEVELVIDPRPTVCVVMASGGYPGPYEKGKVIHGLESEFPPEVVVFHAGTALNQAGETVTAGGRVLGVTARDAELATAIALAYEAVAKISWEGAYFRKDIGRKALRRQAVAAAPRVGIVLGSDSDLPVFAGCREFLKETGIAYELIVASAHRTPERAATYATTARERGIQVIIAGAGMAAHLAGVLAAHTTLPVIGVPIDSSPLNGLDSLLSTAQMPPGVPVATMGIGKSGARNAGILAAQILAVADPALVERLTAFKAALADQVIEKSKAIEAAL